MTPQQGWGDDKYDNIDYWRRVVKDKETDDTPEDVKLLEQDEEAK